MKAWFRDVISETRKLAEIGDYHSLLPMLVELAAGDELDNDERQLVENNLAWTHAHLGEPDRALSQCDDLLARMPRHADLRRFVLGTRGIALVMCGRAAEAVTAIQTALAEQRADRWMRSALLFYGAEALAALGRQSEAQAAWRSAINEHPGIFSDQAALRLRTPASSVAGGSPYRR